jgi:hypothetical protein
MLDRIPRQLRVGFHVHLFEDACAVGANGVYAQRELGSNFAHGLAGSDEPQYLEFAS